MSFHLYNTIYVINISSISEQRNLLCYKSKYARVPDKSLTKRNVADDVPDLDRSGSYQMYATHSLLTETSRIADHGPGFWIVENRP